MDWRIYAWEKYARQRKSWRRKDVKSSMRNQKRLFIGLKHLIKRKVGKSFWLLFVTPTRVKTSVKKNDEGFPIFYESISRGIPDGVNNLIYTILKHFVGTPSNISSQISNYLNNLRCPTIFDYRWYQDVFIFRVMLWKDYYKPYWKEKFIDGLPPIFAHKVKQE